MVENKLIRMINTAGKEITGGLAGLIFLGAAALGPNARADVTNSVSLDPYVTNNATINWDASCWTNLFLIQSKSSGNGTVTGNTNDWIEQGYNATNGASPGEHHIFGGWTGLPAGANTNSNPVVFQVDNTYTNITANFVIESYTVVVNTAYGTLSTNGISTGSSTITNILPWGTEYGASVTRTNYTGVPGVKKILKKAPNVTGHRFTQP